MSVAEGHGIASNQRRWAEWEARLARWRMSETSIRQFCLDEVVSEPSFYQWRKRVLRAGSQFDDRCQLTEFRKWMDGPMPGVLPKSLLSKPLVYVQNQWDALMRYVEDGRLQPDNNTAERALHGIALGRKAWLFCGSAIGGLTAATHFSLIASAVHDGLEPYQYLRCLLEELPLLGDKPTREQLLPYMPNVWRPYNGDSSF
jgi:hypothetical protein